MAVTQNDIARLAGVSQRTVSRCFIEPDIVTQSVRERVLRLAEEAGYRPNLAARSIRRGRFDSVVLIDDSACRRSWAHPLLLASVNERLTQERYHLSLAHLPAGACSSGVGLPTVFGHLMADGLLVNFHPEFPERIERDIGGLPLPTIWINTARAADCVYPNDRSAGRQAAEKLIGLGHQRIAYLDSPHRPQGAKGRYRNCRERHSGYREALLAANLAPRVLAPAAGMVTSELVAFCRRVMTEPDRPTAVVACRLEDAQTLAYAACAGAGLRLPGDLSIVTFADEPVKNAPFLAAHATPWKEMGDLAVRMLLEKIGNPDTSIPPLLLPIPLHPGETLAAPARR